MTCVHCGAELYKETGVCPVCKKDVSVIKEETYICPKCGKRFCEESVFCAGCGTKLVKDRSKAACEPRLFEMNMVSFCNGVPTSMSAKTIGKLCLYSDRIEIEDSVATSNRECGGHIKTIDLRFIKSVERTKLVGFIPAIVLRLCTEETVSITATVKSVVMDELAQEIKRNLQTKEG